MDLDDYFHWDISDKLIDGIDFELYGALESQMDIKECLSAFSSELFEPDNLWRQAEELHLADFDFREALIRILIEGNEELLLDFALEEVAGFPLSVTDEEELVNELDVSRR